MMSNFKGGEISEGQFFPQNQINNTKGFTFKIETFRTSDLVQFSEKWAKLKKPSEILNGIFFMFFFKGC